MVTHISTTHDLQDIVNDITEILSGLTGFEVEEIGPDDDLVELLQTDLRSNLIQVLHQLADMYKVELPSRLVNQLIEHDEDMDDDDDKKLSIIQVAQRVLEEVEY
jgi:hypothetical protein